MSETYTDRQWRAMHYEYRGMGGGWFPCPPPHMEPSKYSAVRVAKYYGRRGRARKAVEKELARAQIDMEEVWGGTR